MDYKTRVSKDNVITAQGNQIWAYAITQLGTDASPKDVAPDELGCAETVTTIISGVFHDMPILISTGALYDYLKKCDKFAVVGTPEAGDVIISPTGFGGFNDITHGHTGIMDNNGVVMSNNSYTGKFERNYTLNSWIARYKTKGGYPIFYFRRIAQ